MSDEVGLPGEIKDCPYTPSYVDWNHHATALLQPQFGNHFISLFTGAFRILLPIGDFDTFRMEEIPSSNARTAPAASAKTLTIDVGEAKSRASYWS